MNAPDAAIIPVPASTPPAARKRLTRDGSIGDRFGLRRGEMYRIAYSAGGSQSRRVSRSLVVYEGIAERRLWEGDIRPCLEFALPHGRGMSLLASQLVEARPAGMNERGQWILAQEEGTLRRRATRRVRRRT